MEHAVSEASGSIVFCVCGEGFSGARAQERAEAHVASPDPNSLGAAFIAYVGTQ